MECQPQNPEFGNDPESFHTCLYNSMINTIALDATLY